MIEVYKKTLTAKGSALHAKCMAGTSGITFTRFVLGNGTYKGTETTAEIAARTALKSPKNSFPVSKAEVVNNATCAVFLNASNLEITAGYYVTEIGLYAKGSDGTEILYSITVAEPGKPDWMPAYNSVAPGSLRYIDYISVGNAESITIKVSAGGLAAQEDLDSLEARVVALEEGAAGCVGVKRRCAADGTPVSATAWERFGNTVGMSPVFVRTADGDEVDDPIMNVWPFNQLHPCDVAMDGTVKAYLGDTDFVWKGSGISVMLEIPTRMFYSRWFQEDENGQNWEYRVFSDTGRYPNAEDIQELMKRADGTKPEHFYFPIFMGSKNSDGNYVSVADEIPQYNATVGTFRAEVKTNGDNWQLIDEWAWNIFKNLCICYAADSNARTTFGRGHADWFMTATSLAAATNTNVVTVANTNTRFAVGNTVCVGSSGAWNAGVAQDRTITKITASTTVDNALDLTLSGAAFTTTTSSVIWRSAPRTGETINMKNANGTAGPNDGQHAVRTLWVEDFYATMHTGIDGLNLKYDSTENALQAWICKDPSKYADSYTDFTDSGVRVPCGTGSDANKDNSGYIKRTAFIRDETLLEVPALTNGGAGSETYEAAMAWINKNGQRPFAGGTFYTGSLDSWSFLSCDATFTNSSWRCASRPLKR